VLSKIIYNKGALLQANLYCFCFYTDIVYADEL